MLTVAMKKLKQGRGKRMMRQRLFKYMVVRKSVSDKVMFDQRLKGMREQEMQLFWERVAGRGWHPEAGVHWVCLRQSKETGVPETALGLEDC